MLFVTCKTKLVIIFLQKERQLSILNPPPEDGLYLEVEALYLSLENMTGLEGTNAIAAALTSQREATLREAVAHLRESSKIHSDPFIADTLVFAAEAIERLIGEPAPPLQPAKLWLWRNFVDGRPEYWAFDNPHPMHDPAVHGHGDPMTFGEPCGYALVKSSLNGRPDADEAEVVATIKRALAKGEPAP